MTASLHGVRIACFFPWKSFEPSGAWSRFTCLWQFLHNEGAEITLPFIERGNDASLHGITVRNLGDYATYLDAAIFNPMVEAMKAAPDLRDATDQEILFLLMFDPATHLKNPKLGPWLDDIIRQQDLVTCDYPMYTPLLSTYCKKWNKPLVLSCLDILHELHATSPKRKQRLKQLEIQAMGMADARVYCNDRERAAFAALGLDGITVLNTGDALAVTPGQEDKCREEIRSFLQLKTPQYCLFVGGRHLPNIEAAASVRQLAKTMPELSFVVAGNCVAKTVENNFHAIGAVTDRYLDTLHRGALAVLVPLLSGTGISVKLFHAFTYGKPVVATPVGARGYALTHGKELLIVPTPQEFPAALRRLRGEPALRQQLGEAARAFAVALDYRTHFQPYRDIVLQLLHRSPSAAAKRQRALVFIDNNLTDRIGHHFNYALSLKAECAAQGHAFVALIKRGALPDVVEELSAVDAFSFGIHEEAPDNPYPPQWGTLRANYDFLLANDRFSRELATSLAVQARPGDLVFLPNATPRQILGLALLLLRSPLYRTMHYVLLLRYSVFYAIGPVAERKLTLDKGIAEKYAIALGNLPSIDPEGRIRLATDSEELAKEYANFTKLPIEVLPIPHTLHAASPMTPAIPPKNPKKCRLVYLGDAREEKGFELLPAVLRASRENPAFAATELVFQAYISSHYHQSMNQYIDELARHKFSHLHLLRGSLKTDDYHALLTSADIVLIPYDTHTYRARTSGSFVEAICADKPVIVPRNSWMSAQLGESGAGVTFVSGNTQDFVRAVQTVVADLPRYAAAAAALGQKFRAYHNPANFLQRLMHAP
ncbi:MAG: glycosyltransferase [Opitutae bacterium]|nr:glycosyltransferase [Opitutae bacterium]